MKIKTFDFIISNESDGSMELLNNSLVELAKRKITTQDEIDKVIDAWASANYADIQDIKINIYSIPNFTLGYPPIVKARYTILYNEES